MKLSVTEKRGSKVWPLTLSPTEGGMAFVSVTHIEGVVFSLSPSERGVASVYTRHEVKVIYLSFLFE